MKTKTNYRRRSKHQLLVLVFLLLIIGLFALWWPPLAPLARPIWSAERAVISRLASTFGVLRSKAALESENDFLKARLAELENIASELDLSRMREGDLRALLGRASDERSVAARVLVRPPQSPYDTLVIDAGSDNGVSVGSKVLWPTGLLIGEIVDVSDKSAKVKLLSSSGEEQAGVLERGEVAVTLLGSGGGNYSIKVPREVPVEIGDRVLSPDINARLIAVVEEVSQRPTDAHKEVLARMPINIFNVRTVLVLP